MRVSLVARNEGVSASLLFQWRKLKRRGALTGCAPIQKNSGAPTFHLGPFQGGATAEKGNQGL